MKIDKVIMYLSFFGAVFFLSQTLINTKKFEAEKKANAILNDSIRYVNGANRYYSDLLEFKIKYSNSLINKVGIKAYDISADTAKLLQTNIHSLIVRSKCSLFLRYTEIGCNECSNLTIEKLKVLNHAHPELPIYILVDFTNYDAYLQWRKVADVNFPVFFVKKGEIAFDEGCNNYSYLFLADNRETAYNFFIPNSRMPDLLDYYLKNAYKLTTENSL
ncbi:hypothetical protein [Chitinophaga vietnamensis]|uniref:hypothetical protein n=1 Tax=Chitinophaga vietnamensis TaxID=2593957 RepID=UPI0011785C8D|nr:hypothetical protein [Chitinophaga vietnamensis]